MDALTVKQVEKLIRISKTKPLLPEKFVPWEDEPKEDDLVLEGEGQRVVVDSVSLPFLTNAVIDFTEELIGARFVIDNPNATSSCGCGTSFSM